MSDLLPVFLIDLDSVLVEPLGYRKAIQSTLAYFTAKMGLGNLYPGEEVIASLEAINMTSEWDITPILLANIFEALLEQNMRLELPGDLLAACESVRSAALPPPKLDYSSLPAKLGGHFKPGMEYASLTYELNRFGAENPPFPLLVEHPLLNALLLNTRSLDGAIITRVFQHYTLGSRRFETLTGLPRLFESESYLETYDKLLLTPESRDLLLENWQKSKLGAAIYTARPSLPETDGATSYHYSPEAEVALETLGLTALPLIGAGKIGWLAERMNVPAHEFAKPSPVQALAAIAAAVTRQTGTSLRAAADFHLNGNLSLFKELPELSIHVFEDSGGNAASVRRAVEQLSKAGLSCTFSAWGIGENPTKLQALLKAGARLVPEVNQAIQLALEFEGL
ncbi:MAG: hypothetical protein CVU42_04545 [Chloroflexi bacterium HGW-Chloroflexi-4]|nr:MAG: hypothetical protein CVU42_04545 [Chloroflexi bacterium HGW-Chloroflexi-4]